MNCAFIFPGQGSQIEGMGREFFESFLVARELFEEASDVLGKNMQKLLFEGGEELNETQWTQPAIFLVSSIAHKIFQSEFPLSPKLVLGHSLGEISALSSASGLGFSQGIKLTHLRGKMMARECEGKEAGMMVVMGLEDAVVEELAEKQRSAGKELWCANYNGEGQIVLAGKKGDLEQASEELKALGAKRALLLPMSVASHCPLLEGMRGEFEALLEELLLPSSAVPVLSNATLQGYSQKDQAKTLLSAQLVSPVQYKQSIKSIDEEIDTYVEFGHGNVLKNLNKRLSTKPTLSVGDVNSLKETLAILTKEIK